jgi:hypothetical protein
VPVFTSYVDHRHFPSRRLRGKTPAFGRTQ